MCKRNCTLFLAVFNSKVNHKLSSNSHSQAGSASTKCNLWHNCDKNKTEIRPAQERAFLKQIRNLSCAGIGNVYLQMQKSSKPFYCFSMVLYHDVMQYNSRKWPMQNNIDRSAHVYHCQCYLVFSSQKHLMYF